MSNSGDVIVDSMSPAQPAPALPVVGPVTWNGLVATIPVTPSDTAVDGNPTAIINIRVAFAVKGEPMGEFKDYPGAYLAGVAVPVSVVVPDWGTDYEFAVEVGN